MNFIKSKDCRHVRHSECGEYNIGETLGTPRPDGTPLNFYSAWHGTTRIPCGPATYKACIGACITHKKNAKYLKQKLADKAEREKANGPGDKDAAIERCRKILG